MQRTVINAGHHQPLWLNLYIDTQGHDLGDKMTEEKIECKLCNMGFASKKELDEHISKHHKH
jgi:hypothetical protein